MEVVNFEATTELGALFPPSFQEIKANNEINFHGELQTGRRYEKFGFVSKTREKRKKKKLDVKQLRRPYVKGIKQTFPPLLGWNPS